MIHSQIPFRFRMIENATFVLLHLFPKYQWIENLRAKNVLNIISRLKQNVQILEVDRRQNLSEEEFVKNYLNLGLPVIFDGEAAAWACSQKWNLDFFKDGFAEKSFSLIELPGLTEIERTSTQTKMNAKEYVESIRSGGKDYLRFCPVMETNPELKNDLDQAWLKKMRKCFMGVSYQTFIGPKGRKTPLHSDTTAFFYIMAHGEKKWTMFSPSSLALIKPEVAGRGYNYSKVNVEKPDLKLYPGFHLLNRYTCTLKAGDILFVPAWMWHEVENLSESWGISYRFTSLRGFFQFPNYAFVRMALTRPSFIKILYYSFFKSDLAKRDQNLLTPKIFLDE